MKIMKGQKLQFLSWPQLHSTNKLLMKVSSFTGALSVRSCSRHGLLHVSSLFVLLLHFVAFLMKQADKQFVV